MPGTVKAAFRPDVVSLRIDSLVPTRDLDPRERYNAKYKQIATSLTVVGLIEPLVLLATDDEGYTYNKRVNYLSPVGEHRMILRALEHNTEEVIAEALNVNVCVIRRKRALLN